MLIATKTHCTSLSVLAEVLNFGFSGLVNNHFMPVWGFLLRYKRPCRTLYKRLPFPKRLRYASGMLQNSLTKLLGVQIILMFVATPHSSSSMSSSYCCIEVKMPHNSLHRLKTLWATKRQNPGAYLQHHCAWKSRK